MDPQYQPPVYADNSLEYLNQIAPQKTSPMGFLNKKVLAIAAAVVLVVIIIVAILASSKPAATPSSQILGYRIIGLNELVTFGQNSTINDSGLRKALAETKIIALSEQYQISTYLTLPKTDSKTPVPADESVASDLTALNKAVSSGNFNKHYADALISQIEKIKTSLGEIRSQSESQVTILKVDEDLAQYNALIERLADY
ncbi:MAG: hypothetical protein LBU20_02440 [Candidatus Nomurabacteria bacterium]|jgi:hypothetical protein|nr:hypothetical protein [Candidatus Nomurabacteria bacterium]